MKDELRRRISEALDSAGGIDGDADLRALLASDAEAARYAGALRKLGDSLRAWPLREPSDDAFEALASRIEQRLDEELPRIADPTEAPEFDDDDSLRDATAALLGAGALTSGEFELEEYQSIPPPAKPEAPIAKTDGVAKKDGNGAPKAAHLRAVPPPPSPGAPGKAKDAPPPPPPKKKKKRKSKPPPPAAPGKEDRFSIPSMPPPALGAPTIMPLDPTAAATPPKTERKSQAWMAGLAAAAMVGLAVLAGTNLMSSGSSVDELAGSAAPAAAPRASSPTAGPTPEEAPPAVAAALPAAPMPVTTPAAEPAPIEAEAPVMDMLAGPGRGGGGSGGYGLADDGDAREEGSRETTARARRSSGAASTVATASPAAAAPARIGGGGGRAASSEADEGRGGSPRGSAASAGPAEGGTGTSGGATATTRTEPPPPRPTPPEDLPELPERGAVLSAVQGVEPAVRACAGDEHGVADVRIVVASSGRVTTATVSGAFAGTPVGSCIARAVRRARFPEFSRDRFEFEYPFHF